MTCLKFFVTVVLVIYIHQSNSEDWDACYQEERLFFAVHQTQQCYKAQQLPKNRSRVLKLVEPVDLFSITESEILDDEETYITKIFIDNHDLSDSIGFRRGIDEVKEDIDHDWHMPRIPDDCKQLGICNRSLNYPQKLIDKIIHRIGKDVIFDMDYNYLLQEESADNIKPLCNYREEISSLHVAPDLNDKLHFILNTKPPIQQFKTQTCTSKTPAFDDDIATTPYKGTCEQKFVLRYVLSLDEDKKPLSLPLKIPSCCVYSIDINDNKDDNEF